MPRTKRAARRPTLASHLERLDATLDGLAGRLEQTVRTAVAGAVGPAASQALQEAVLEVITRPEVAARLSDLMTQPATPTAPNREGLTVTCPGLLATAAGVTVRGLRTAHTVRRLPAQCRRITLALKIRLAVVAAAVPASVRQWREETLVAGATGLALGLLPLLVGPLLTALYGGLAGCVGVLLLLAGRARRQARRGRRPGLAERQADHIPCLPALPA